MDRGNLWRYVFPVTGVGSLLLCIFLGFTFRLFGVTQLVDEREGNQSDSCSAVCFSINLFLARPGSSTCVGIQVLRSDVTQFSP